jgi:adenosylcobinamide-phosphate synthase
MAFPLALLPSAPLLATAVALDLVLGDPDYAWHPVRLMGRTLRMVEAGLRRIGWDGYGGGVVLFVILAGPWVTGVSAIVVLADAWLKWTGAALHLFVLYSLLALGSLLRHGRRVEDALRKDDLPGARMAVAQIVGRDTAMMDEGACRRAAVESLTESLTDGVVSPLFWYAIGGLPMLILFKVVSTMDSMVGYRTSRYLRFGWCGARLDDLMNYVPARVSWLLIAGVAALIPACSARNGLRIGLRDHALLPSPNSGWSEAAAAGALQRRLVGPIWSHGQLVTERWIGDSSDPPLSTAHDYDVAARLVTTSGLVAAGVSVLVAISWSWFDVLGG